MPGGCLHCSLAMLNDSFEKQLLLKIYRTDTLRLQMGFICSTNSYKIPLIRAKTLASYASKVPMTLESPVS